MSKNIVFTSRNQIEVLAEQLGDLGPAEITCRTVCSLVSLGTEGFCLLGEYDPGTYWEDYIQYPIVPGYSSVGIVEAVGQQVQDFRPGDRVTTLAGHRQRFNIQANQAFPIPDDITDEQATWATLARTTQLGVRRAKLKMGESVAVIGLGILGQLVVQYCSLMGARHIIAIDSNPTRLKLAEHGGATHALLGTIGASSIDYIKEVTGGEMMDVVFDVTGHPQVLSWATLCLHKLGRLVLLGDCPEPSKQALGPRTVGDSLSILGIHGFMHPAEATPFNKWTTRAMTELFFDYLRRGIMNVDGLVTHRESFTAANKVYNEISKEQGALGIVLVW